VSRTHAVHDGAAALERLQTLPGGPELLAQARRREDIALVGGAVRDLLLGHWPRELDVTVASDSAGLAAALAASLSPSERAYGHPVAPQLHDRFGTASVAWDYGRVDIAELRAESYPSPGALPEVRPGTVEEDLVRRDFTVNAISLPLAGAERGRPRMVGGALEDLAAGTLRVLHDRSFIDDPTRIMRLARYSARLGFDIDPATRRLADQAIESGALGTVSEGRIGAEMLLAVSEADGRGALRAFDELGVLAALELPVPFDDELAADAEALLPADGSRDVLLLAVAFHGSEAERSDELVLARMNGLEIPAELAKRALGAKGIARLARGILSAADASGAYALLDGAPVEAVAVAGALAGRESEQAAAIAREWLTAQRHVALAIDGHDLIAAGVPEGPELGARLGAALRRKREGGLPTPEEELRWALETEIEEGEL
jgi:tRNA nucleotidyltransferase (CCA-adding enzyme)